MGPRPFGRGRSIRRSGGGRGRGLQWGRDLSVAEGGAGNAARGYLAVLQWGRDLSVAEGRMARYIPRHTGRLQWGRDLSVAEGRRRPPEPAAKNPLQWGRDLSVAEGPHCSARRGRQHGFNGAATFRSRKVIPPPMPTPPATSFNGAATFRSRKGARRRRSGGAGATLQWGRDLSVAEGRRADFAPPDHYMASMGPRPFGRGRLIVGLAPISVWRASMGPRPFGRGRVGMRPPCTRFSQLQWGRDLSVAEGPRLLPARARARGASMGPRPFGRGRRERNAVVGPQPQLQWGRDLSVAEGSVVRGAWVAG